MRKMLQTLFNQIMIDEEIPEEWEVGLIVPIFKNEGERDVIDNYRGITILSIVSKLFEKVIMSRLTEWSNSKGVIEEEQGGFRAGRGCVELIWLLREVIDGRREARQKTYILFLDVKKAYDTVWQNGLWKKMKEAGVPVWLVNLLKRWYSKFIKPKRR